MGQHDTTDPIEDAAGLEVLFDDLLRRAAEERGGKKPRLRDWVDLAEAWRIAHALREARGNRSAAARALGIGRRTLYSKMDKLGIAPSWGFRAAPPPGAGMNGASRFASGSTASTK
jgi:DNA-binding NtrC family response regulator